MRGKVRMVFLAVLMVAMAGAAQAETIIPMVPGYNVKYEVNWAGVTSNPYLASMTITGGPGGDLYNDGNQWWPLQFTNWDGDGVSSSDWMRATETAVYLGGSIVPHFQTGDIGTSWIDEGGRPVEIVDFGNFKTPAGLDFPGVYTLNINDYSSDGTLYQQLTEYWKPGVGFLGEVVPLSYGDSELRRTTYITAYATPVPPSLLLLGSGLVGLWGVRRLRRS